MIHILLNSIALDPNRWTRDKIAYFDLAQLLKPIARAGFQFVELWQYHISRASANRVREFREMADSLGLSFPVIGMYPKLHLDGYERKDELDKVELLMNYARILGADIIKIFVGCKGSKQVSDSEYQRSVEFMQGMLEMAGSFGLTLTGETHPDTLFDTISSCVRFRKAVNGENFKVCFQPFDFFDTERAINDYYTLAADVIHVHYQGRKDGKMELLSVSDLDHAKLTTALVERGFSGKICIEFVKDCVVKDPRDLDIKQVLENAVQDRDLIVKTLDNCSGVEYIY